MRTVVEAAGLATLARRYGLRRVAAAFRFVAGGPLAGGEASHEPPGRARRAAESAWALATPRTRGGSIPAPTGRGLFHGARAP